MTTVFRPRKGERVVYREQGAHKWRAAIVLVVHKGDTGVKLRYTTDGKHHLDCEASVHNEVREPIADEAIELKRHWDYLSEVAADKVEELVETHVPLYQQLQSLGFKANKVAGDLRLMTWNVKHWGAAAPRDRTRDRE